MENQPPEQTRPKSRLLTMKDRLRTQRHKNQGQSSNSVRSPAAGPDVSLSPDTTLQRCGETAASPRSLSAGESPSQKPGASAAKRFFFRRRHAKSKSVEVVLSDSYNAAQQSTLINSHNDSSGNKRVKPDATKKKPKSGIKQFMKLSKSKSADKLRDNVTQRSAAVDNLNKSLDSGLKQHVTGPDRQVLASRDHRVSQENLAEQRLLSRDTNDNKRPSSPEIDVQYRIWRKEEPDTRFVPRTRTSLNRSSSIERTVRKTIVRSDSGRSRSVHAQNASAPGAAAAEYDSRRARSADGVLHSAVASHTSRYGARDDAHSGVTSVNCHAQLPYGYRHQRSSTADSLAQVPRRARDHDHRRAYSGPNDTFYDQNIVNHEYTSTLDNKSTTSSQRNFRNNHRKRDFMTAHARGPTMSRTVNNRRPPKDRYIVTSSSVTVPRANDFSDTQLIAKARRVDDSYHSSKRRSSFNDNNNKHSQVIATTAAAGASYNAMSSSHHVPSIDTYPMTTSTSMIASNVSSNQNSRRAHQTLTTDGYELVNDQKYPLRSSQHCAYGRDRSNNKQTPPYNHEYTVGNNSDEQWQQAAVHHATVSKVRGSHWDETKDRDDILDDSGRADGAAQIGIDDIENARDMTMSRDAVMPYDTMATTSADAAVTSLYDSSGLMTVSDPTSTAASMTSQTPEVRRAAYQEGLALIDELRLCTPPTVAVNSNDDSRRGGGGGDSLTQASNVRESRIDSLRSEFRQFKYGSKASPVSTQPVVSERGDRAPARQQVRRDFEGCYNVPRGAQMSELPPVTQSYSTQQTLHDAVRPRQPHVLQRRGVEADDYSADDENASSSKQSGQLLLLTSECELSSFRPGGASGSLSVCLNTHVLCVNRVCIVDLENMFSVMVHTV